MLERLPNYIKPTVFLSILAGLVLGILLLIPALNILALFLFWLVGGMVIYLLKKNNFIGQFTQREGIIVGCITGMISIIAASVSFIPLSLLIGAIFKTASVAFLFSTTFSSNIVSFSILVMIILFLGLINIIFNIASALAVIAIYNNLVEEKQEETEFKVEL
ncbi:MAG: hypothetical protein MJ180_00665 [Candidatus Gastranaerophilales bacterium]|nr:hypothetical protein [Candidatus Gastranaerophilales bacterium]